MRRAPWRTRRRGGGGTLHPTAAAWSWPHCTRASPSPRRRAECPSGAPEVWTWLSSLGTHRWQHLKEEAARTPTGLQSHVERTAAASSGWHV